MAPNPSSDHDRSIVCLSSHCRLIIKIHPWRSPNENSSSVDRFKRLHDVRVVWPLKFKEVTLWKVILISWGIAFFEYCLQVPANRIGHGVYSAAQLKIIQEVITLVVFGVFSVLYLREELKWNYIVAFLLILGAVFFAFKEW